MKRVFIFLALLTSIFSLKTNAQNITYSEVEKADSRSLNFEILGKFDDNFLIYKNLNRSHKLTVYDYGMVIKETIKLDFISDRTSNIDFVSYPNCFLMVWQYQKGNVTYCKAAKMDGAGKLLGNVLDLDTTRSGVFSNTTYYNLIWSEDKKKVLLYKTQSRNENFNLVTKVYDENLLLLDSTRRMLEYNNNRESFGDLQIDNNGNIVFTKLKENARQEYINTLDINIKKFKVDNLITVNVPLEKQLIQEPVLKIDNLNGRYVINSFSYKKNGGNVDGIFTAIVSRNPFELTKKAINIFDDSLRSKLSGRPDWRTAYDDYFLKNIILKKDGGFIVVSEEYTKQRRFGGGAFDNGFNSGLYGSRYYGSASDYYFYNRGYSGFYRPFNDGNQRDIVYNYNDIITYSFSKDLQLQWNNVINKTTSDVETDNFLSFANMNAGAEIHFLFLQKDNNRQILSDHAVQPNGSVIRYATLKSREAGYSFMPRLARQTGARQMIVPCIVRNNIAFAKIDF
jgi:hypothetical protein